MSELPYEPRRPNYFLRIFAVVGLMLIVICGGLVTLIAYKFRPWTAHLVRSGLVELVQSSELPEAQQQDLIDIFNQVADDYEARKIAYGPLVRAAEQLADGPFMELIIVEAVKSSYADQTKDSTETQQQTNRLFDRFQRGIVEESIPPKDATEALSLVAGVDDQGNMQFSDNVSATQIEAFTDKIAELVEDADVPDEAYDVNYAHELRKVLGDTLGAEYGPTTTQTAPATEPTASAPTRAPPTTQP